MKFIFVFFSFLFMFEGNNDLAANSKDQIVSSPNGNDLVFAREDQKVSLLNDMSISLYDPKIVHSVLASKLNYTYNSGNDDDLLKDSNDQNFIDCNEVMLELVDELLTLSGGVSRWYNKCDAIFQSVARFIFFKDVQHCCLDFLKHKRIRDVDYNQLLVMVNYALSDCCYNVFMGENESKLLNLCSCFNVESMLTYLRDFFENGKFLLDYINLYNSFSNNIQNLNDLCVYDELLKVYAEDGCLVFNLDKYVFDSPNNKMSCFSSVTVNNEKRIMELFFDKILNVIFYVDNGLTFLYDGKVMADFLKNCYLDSKLLQELLNLDFFKGLMPDNAAAKEKQYHDLLNGVKETLNRQSDVLSQNSNDNNNVAELKSENEDLKIQVDNSKAKCEKLEENVVSLKSENESLKKQNDATIAELTRTQKLTICENNTKHQLELERIRQDYEQKIANLNSEHEQKVNELNDKVDKLNATNESLTKENKNLTEINKSLEVKNSNLDKLCSTVFDENGFVALFIEYVDDYKIKTCDIDNKNNKKNMTELITLVKDNSYRTLYNRYQESKNSKK